MSGRKQVKQVKLQQEQNKMLKQKRQSRHKKIRRKVMGTEARPRVAVFRSSQHIYAQLIDDSKAITLASQSDLGIEKGTKSEKANEVGEKLAQKVLKLKIKKIVFDRGGFKYHGRIATLAAGLRKGGLEF